MPERIVLLARESSATAILYHALAPQFDVRVLYEQAPTTLRLLRSRVKRLGLLTVIGQVLFQMMVAKPLGWLSRTRKAEILRTSGVPDAPIPADRIAWVNSVNDPACWDQVRSLAPRAVVINGTRILSKKTIAALGVPVLNTHVGITPMYRGVHGAYWALVQDDRAHCGVTVHLVDEGVDTGSILHQALIEPTAADNFCTYPTLQMVAGSRLMAQALGWVFAGRQQPRKPEGADRRWEIPTLWAYCLNRFRGVK
jgi:phosphoribosylglycinamide formyltransferase 1